MSLMGISYFFIPLVLGVFAFSPIFAESSITFSVDKSSVSQPFEKFLITGKVSSTEPVRQVMIQIFSPSGALMYSPTVPLDGTGNFKVVPRVESSWTEVGAYTIEVTTPKGDGMATSQIQYNKGAFPTTPSLGSMMIEGFSVSHNLGSSLISSSVDMAGKSLKFTLSGANSKSSFDVTLPSGLIQNPNAVMVDGQPVNDFTLTPTSSGVQISIPIKSSSKEIIIIGTSVVPEFGSISALILVISIIAVILVTVKYQKFSIPKI